jgi:cyclophilin family peptidyl-prolyl cis-trans isomerase
MAGWITRFTGNSYDPPVDLEKKNTFGVEKTPETISMENTGTTRNLSEVFFSQEIWF